jgi:hypothetical protein
MTAVTDHALLRYLERLCGVDVQPVRRRLRCSGFAASDREVLIALAMDYDLRPARRALEEIVARAARLGASAICHEGHRFVVANGALVTVCPISSGRASRAS